MAFIVFLFFPVIANVSFAFQTCSLKIILKKIFAILLIFTFQSSAFGANTAENSLDIKLIDNQFHTSEGKVPAGCFYNLAVELNGDDLVRSVYLNRGYLRGCINADIVYPGMEDATTFDYSVIKKTGKYEYDINACRTHEWPYKNCNKFSIRFKNFDYRIDGVVKQVLGVEKIGNL